MGLLNIRKPDGSWEEVANVGGTYIEEPTTGEKFLGGLKLDDNTLKVEDGKLSVNTTDIIEEDNTKPITSSAVKMQLGNIESLLENI